ncbi:DUF5700 domain-containing putative Zn-dependent protease [Ferruginibacter sp.]
MKSIAIFLSLIFIAGYSKAQLNTRFDFTNADATIAFLKKAHPTEADIDRMVKSDGVKTIIKKIRSTDSIARIALYKAAAGIPAAGKEKNFQFDFIKAQLPEMENFIARIKNNTRIITDSIQSLAHFLPVDKKATVTVCFLLGGYSSGFTMDDDNIFYVGTHQYKSDLTGIVNTCQHELFHNIQSLLYDRSKVLKALQDSNELPALYATYLLQNIFIEGSAEYVADIDKMDTASPYIKREIEHYSVNNYRMADNFFVLENIIMSAYRDPEKMDADMAYRVLFDWNWNNIGYAVGKQMCKAMVKIYGPDVLKKYLLTDPVFFIRDYIQLAKTNSTAFPYNFTKDFEQMIDTVAARITALKINNP